MIKVLLVFLLIWQAYLFYDLVSPPKISVFEPKEKFVFQDEILLKGKVDDRAILFLNGARIFPNSDGYFEKKIYLNPGVNRLLLQAKKFWGQENDQELIIIYQKKP